ncbi:MAG: SPOR domain-containing protein [Pseudomonadales bacterium]|nr:SPOR domain-containing protein [Pseudomonadales bacterium]MBO7007759.1 SPOR domain-containing protein [Pseudomonadales bacterium]
MDAKLKQRLTGAVILTCLAIIVLPLLLDGTEQERARVIADIPEPPRIELSDITVQDIERQMVQMEKASEARLPKEVVDETDYEASPDFILDKNNLPVNWSLQLGSFQSKENATRLRTQLREQNYRCYILHSKTSDGEIFRVFVGPSGSKEALVKMSVEIEQKLQLKGRIVRYRIEEDREQLGG